MNNVTNCPNKQPRAYLPDEAPEPDVAAAAFWARQNRGRADWVDQYWLDEIDRRNFEHGLAPQKAPIDDAEAEAELISLDEALEWQAELDAEQRAKALNGGSPGHQSVSPAAKTNATPPVNGGGGGGGTQHATVAPGPDGPGPQRAVETRRQATKISPTMMPPTLCLTRSRPTSSGI